MTTWQPIPEPDLVPYRPLEPLPARRLLVLAPHPDDEVFGVGGTLARALDQGGEACVVVVSDGGAGGEAAVRERESRAAAAALGHDPAGRALQFWRLPDRGLRPDAALAQRIREAIEAQQPQWLLAPSPFEVHPDHRAVCRAAIDAAAGTAVELVFYEVGQALMPNALVDITPVLARKRAAIACFGSQLGVQRYDEQVLALNRYRAYTLGAAVTHAEALWRAGPVPREGAGALLESIRQQLARRLGVEAG
ncbi:MAG: PIG-L family deacetylase [Burkholderiales bacterium]|nr:PIG-L family deacetylase [Burkholderiales bacterium]